MFKFAEKTVLLAVVMVLSLAGGLAQADTTVPCIYDGYVAMGGMVFNTNNSYLLPSYAYSEPSGAMETFGYSFLKFDAATLPDQAVSQAYLVLDVIAVQDGMSWPVAGTANVGAFGVSADIGGITAATADAFRASIASVADDSVSMTGAGTISLDITSLVNQWISSGDNYGLVLASPGGLMPRISSADTTSGVAPYISVVPEPATIGLMAFGAAIVSARRQRRRS